jgi:hypothetical protein
MTQSTIPVLTCDRCGYEVEVRGHNSPLSLGWGRMFAAETKSATDDRPRMIGTTEAAADMCPACMTGIIEWWRAPNAPIEQPEVPPPKPRPCRLGFSLADRRAAIDVAARALADQANATVTAARANPAAFLADEDRVPAQPTAMVETAAALVDDVALLLKAKGNTDAAAD